MALKRLDFDFAKLNDASILHNALSILQAEHAIFVLAVSHVHGLDAVEHDHEMVALSGDFIGIPLASGLWHWHHLGHIHDCSGTIFRFGPFIVNIHLIAGLGVHLLGVRAADKNTAIGVVIDPEFGFHLKIAIGPFRN